VRCSVTRRFKKKEKEKTSLLIDAEIERKKYRHKRGEEFCAFGEECDLKIMVSIGTVDKLVRKVKLSMLHLKMYKMYNDL